MNILGQLTPINMNQPSKDAVLELLNRDNNSNETWATIQFGPVQSMPTGAVRNSSIDVTPTPGSNRRGSRRVFYNRIQLSDAFQNVEAEVEGDDVETIYGLLPAINERYNLALDATDIEPGPIESNTVVLHAKPSSYGWLGSVTITIVDSNIGDIDLAYDVVLADLIGFNATTHTPDLEEAHAQNLLNLINTQNNRDYNSTNTYFGSPVVISEGGRNTRVRLFGSIGEGYTGYKDINYSRVNFTQFITNMTEVFLSVEGPSSVHAILDELNDLLGLNLGPDEVLDTNFDTGTDSQFVLTATSNSYVWAPGSTLTLVFSDLPDGYFIDTSDDEGEVVLLGLDDDTLIDFS